MPQGREFWDSWLKHPYRNPEFDPLRNRAGISRWLPHSGVKEQRKHLARVKTGKQ